MPTEKHYITNRGEAFILPGFRYETNGVERWYINSRLYYIGTGNKAPDSSEEESTSEPIAKIDFAGLENELLIFPGDSKNIEFTIKNYNGSSTNKESLDCYLDVEFTNLSFDISYKIFDITDGQEIEVSKNINGYGPLLLGNQGKQDKTYKLVLNWNEKDTNIKNAGQMCKCNINLKGSGKYDKVLDNDEMIIKAHEYKFLSANVERLSDSENKFNINIKNENPYNVTCKISGSENFIVTYDGNPSEVEINILANDSKPIEVNFESQPNELYTGAKRDENNKLYTLFNMVVNTSAPYNGSDSIIAENLKIYLADSVKSTLVANSGNIHVYEEGERFDDISASDEANLCSIIDPVSKKIVYFYRGNITNNYVNFAGMDWRILRINDDGSLRLILDGSAGNSKYANSNATSGSNATIDDALDLVDWKESVIYKSLHDWYNSNIGSKSEYSSYVVESKFVFDNSYELSTSSTGGGDCYYFGPYLRIGKDEDNYQPTFSYNDKTLVEDVVGLITADEILYAGGYWGKDNTRYFLYNSSIKKDSWTMSPSFWDYNTHKKIGVMVLGSSGRAHDWPSDNTLTDSLPYRPVISIRGDLAMKGDGTKNNPYHY